ncbi:hypothetical protein DFJ63DRAFT_335242 [Scheffersomyces coipomensis]|uniref:uncharacterized protein n=1 Tax=Scheffersomyces coipomensis TaxID=1788519 RepID=UPI00315C6892
MAQFGGFNNTYLDSMSSSNSDTIPASSSNSEITQGVPIIKHENVDDIFNRNDVRKQLSQSFQNAGSGIHITGGINKPQSRKGSIIPNIRSNNASDDEDDNGNTKSNDKKEIPKPDMVTLRIQELLTLIPNDMFQDMVKNKKSPIKDEPNDDDLDDEDEDGKTTGTKDGKPNKGQILTKSLEYIDILQKQIDDNNHAEATLKLKLRDLEKKANLLSSDLALRPTSGERALGEIGIGNNPALTDTYYKRVLVSSANTNKAAQRRGSTTQ